MYADLDKGIDSNLDAALISGGYKKGIGHTVKNGVVTLTGTVDTEDQRNQLTALAKGVPVRAAGDQRSVDAPRESNYYEPDISELPSDQLIGPAPSRVIGHHHHNQHLFRSISSGDVLNRSR